MTTGLKVRAFWQKVSTLYHNINNYQTKKLRTHPIKKYGTEMLDSNWTQLQAHQIQN